MHSFAAQGNAPEPSTVTAQGDAVLPVAPGSAFLERAQHSVAIGLHSRAILLVAVQLEDWVAYQESGLANLKPFEVRFRIEASTDIMEQAQDLLRDQNVHLAAPVVLAGASLEEFLRSIVVDAGLTPTGKPGINTYTTELQKSS